MGRPLQKKFFGNPDGSGKQLVLSYVWLEGSTAAETGYWVVRQVGTGRYQVTNGTKTGVVRLVDAMPDAAGEGVIEIAPFGATQREYARVIHNRTVRTWDMNTYKWSKNAAEEEGQADLPFEIALPVDEEEDAVEAIVAAADGQAVVDLLLAQPEVYLVSDTKIVFDTLTPTSRQLAVGLGVAEWAELFGGFTSLNQVRDAVDLHTATEQNKMALVVEADATATAKSLEKSLKKNVPIVVADRKKMIADLKASGVPAAITRAEELEAESFTVVLNALNDRIAQGGFTALAQVILDGRNALSNSKFFGTDRMLPVVEEALTA